MRNLIEFPLTKDEVLTAIDTATMRAGDDDGCGSIEELALMAAHLFIEEMSDDETFKDFGVK